MKVMHHKKAEHHMAKAAMHHEKAKIHMEKAVEKEMEKKEKSTVKPKKKGGRKMCK